MVNITLTNKNLASQDENVTINIETGLCTFQDKREIKLKELINNPDFCHPLLSEKITLAPDNIYHYEYDDIDGLLNSAIYVYSTLLKVDNPLAVTFKINPSPHYQQHKITQTLSFSIDSRKIAQETISINQFEHLISQLMGFRFVFSEDCIINDQITITDLPTSIMADLLYKTNDSLVALLKNPLDLNRLEIRYINPRIGFGIFSKRLIKKDEIISPYTGLKIVFRPDYITGYRYKPINDCLNLSTDAKFHGNIVRFINHADNPEKSTQNSSHIGYANLISESHLLNGIEITLYKATRDIFPGEQLLVSYGNYFFSENHPVRFTQDGQPSDSKIKFLQKDAKKRINHLEVMAKHGVKKAETYLRSRMLIKAVLLSLSLALLQAYLK